MRKKIHLLLLSGLLCLHSFTQINAQAYKGGLLENWAVGANAGLYGFGLHGATSLMPKLKVRIGFDYLAYSYKEAITFEAPSIYINPITKETIEGPDMSGKLSDVTLKFPNFKTMVDFYPWVNGIFCLTAGFYVGNNNITANGLIDNYSTTIGRPKFAFDDIVIQPDPDGSFDATVKVGGVFKPYFGIGLGRTIPKNRVGFRFDLGVVYQGNIRIESDNVVEGIETVNDMAADIDVGVPKNLLKLWPMMNFALTYRIK